MVLYTCQEDKETETAPKRVWKRKQKNLKNFKKSLDKIPLMWYNKYVVKREKRKPSQSEFGNGNKKTLDK